MYFFLTNIFLIFFQELSPLPAKAGDQSVPDESDEGAPKKRVHRPRIEYDTDKERAATPSSCTPVAPKPKPDPRSVDDPLTVLRKSLLPRGMDRCNIGLDYQLNSCDFDGGLNQLKKIDKALKVNNRVALAIQYKAGDCLRRLKHMCQRVNYSRRICRYAEQRRA